ncbi:PREDICTED: DENN domain-containing protein 2A isoform X2 [Nanorana parkeri]|uniref:DENN domain-containing protein 2A isoform X2 n=1 Tax=Nanorana parkeri TaxID=125878 RepID=UPI0008546A42|nr:PREDICTED: DENN domain-containing protein 2A isoform X2 [Nanorana parkeri]
MTVRRAAEVTRNKDHTLHQSSRRVNPTGKENSGTWKKLELLQFHLSIKTQAVSTFTSVIYKQEFDQEKTPFKGLENWPSDKDLQGLGHNMLSNKMIINDPVMEINVKDPGLIIKKQLGNTKSSPSPQKITLKKTSSIKDKISEWEGKKETLSPNLSRKELIAVKRQDSFGTTFGDTTVDDGRNRQKTNFKRMFSWEMENKDIEQTESQKVEKKREKEANLTTERLQEQVTGTKKDQTTVLNQVKRFERSLKDSPADGLPQLPGTYYSPQSLLDSENQENKVGSKSKWGSDSENAEPIFGTVGEGRASRRTSNAENVYTEPGAPEKPVPINPLPKPRRTFRHEGDLDPVRTGLRKMNRDLPPLPCILPPPLPTSPPPSAVSRRLWNSKHRNNGNHRKSYEFEDLLQSSENGRVDWYAQTKLALTRTLSEENVYEDILDPPSKENPYEDIETDSRCLGKKCVPGPVAPVPGTLSKKPPFFRQNSERRSFKLLDLRKLGRDGGASPSKLSPPSSPSSPDDNFFNSGDQQNGRRRRKIPKLVMRINSIYEARRGKKRVKRLLQSADNSGRVTDDNSESDSDTEEKLKAHSQRLVHVKSRMSLTPRYQTLERDLIEYQERQLFEYFVVVSLQKKSPSTVYAPEITQQFPLKLERSFKFMREAGDQFKAIPQFCFPDTKDWTQVTEFDSETFSFVLTGEDGSRRFGYCRRLLPSGKGKRFPEVYCIVSRLGCFNLFSKILDEVEKRRGLSTALVQPFMRAIMEAPFPALGKKITVKNFLPGSGTEVIELCRPLDSRLEHVDFEALFSTLSVRHLIQVFASLLLERRVIFMAETLSTLSKCCHAMVALIYPFTWQHTYIPVLPPAMIDIVCSPTPFLIGLLSNSLPHLKDLPVEEVLLVDLGNDRLLRQMDDEESILPRKLQAALEQILEQRNELASDIDISANGQQDSNALNDVVSEAFVRFFVEIVGHYSLFMVPGEQDERTLVREAFRKSVSSKSVRRFLEVFMETQMFGGFTQEREMRKQGTKGLFEVRAQEYLETLPGGEQSGVNKFFNRIGSKMWFRHKK